MKKPKLPIQIVLMDDDGCEVFNGYVTEGAESFYALNSKDPDGLMQAMKHAINQPLEDGHAKWITI